MTDTSKAVENAYAIMRGGSIARSYDALPDDGSMTTGDAPPHWDDLSDAQRKAFTDVCEIATISLRADLTEAMEVARDWVPTFDPLHSKACNCRICRGRALIAKHGGSQ